jgi:arginase
MTVSLRRYLRADGGTQTRYSGSKKNCGAVAQLGEHRLCKPGVRGSIPLCSICIAYYRLGILFSSKRRPLLNSRAEVPALECLYRAHVTLGRTYEIIGAEFDSGGRVRGTALAPKALRGNRLVERLRATRAHIEEGRDIFSPATNNTSHRPGPPHVNDLPEAEAFCQEMYRACSHTLGLGRVPIVIGGDHSISIASVSAAAEHARMKHGPDAKIGLIWVDAHPDLNTPESSPSGNLHGMVTRILLGEGPSSLTSLGSPQAKLRAENLALIAIRDVDPPEKKFIKESPACVVTMKDIDMHGAYAGMRRCIEAASKGTVGIVVSFDLDSCDPSIAPGVDTPVRGGLSYREAHLIMEMVAELPNVLSLELVEYDPNLDTKHACADLAIALLESALGKSIL